MTNKERFEQLERRIEALDHEALMHRPLGPLPPARRAADIATEIVGLFKEAVAEPPTVDRSARVLCDGSPETADYREINPVTGQQKDYVVLSAEERAKGYVRPVRTSYQHLKCGVVTHMSMALAQTYARDPEFYSGTFCYGCRTHFPLDQFVWDGTNEKVGS